jgi:hypothetical protein
MKLKSSFLLPRALCGEKVGVCLTLLKEMASNGQPESTDKIPCRSVMRRFPAAIGMSAMTKETRR